MQQFLLTLASLIAYGAGLVIILRVTPLLLSHAYDEGWFMLIAAGDLSGGILAFGGVWVPLVIFNASIPIRVLAFLLLVGIVYVTARMSFSSFRPRTTTDTFRFSRVLAGTYCLALVAAAIYCIVLLFTSL